MSRTPLLVHLFFHPESSPARDLALHLFRALNDDAAVPGLRLPTVFGAEDGTGFPPVQHDLDEAERSVVVVLADDNMVVEPTVAPGRQTWSVIQEVNSEYNGRQACSIIGGQNYSFEDCKFNHSGKGGIASAPSSSLGPRVATAALSASACQPTRASSSIVKGSCGGCGTPGR